ncbi:MAG: hypothetical protein LBT29_08800 [Flavobacteriaceae bacterium]|jgi:hypothetical protein|nr:hypothetical protein [Flavobacteriaceae bacterium]
MNCTPKMYNRKNVRLKEYDYSQEVLYFATICVQQDEADKPRPHLFGEIVGGEMILKEFQIIL